MKKYSDFRPEKTATREQLPAGGYVAKILDAKEIEYSWGAVILISIDIAEGEKKEFFAKDYRGQPGEDKKWRGTYRLVEPKDDGSEKDAITKRVFNNAIAVLEESNNGYHFDWEPVENGDFSQLKGKLVGVVYRNREWSYNGRTGWSTECGTLTSVEDIRQNKFRPLKDKPLAKSQNNNLSAMPTADAIEVVVSDGDLPF